MFRFNYLESDVRKFRSDVTFKDSVDKVSEIENALRQFETFYLASEVRPIFQLRRNDLLDLLSTSRDLVRNARYETSENYDND